MQSPASAQNVDTGFDYDADAGKIAEKKTRR